MNMRTHSGITLVELVVAVGVLTFAIAGPMTLASSSLRATRDAENELIATHLAQEGIEIIHSVRDNNSAKDDDPSALDHKGWTKKVVDIVSACGGTYGCVVDVTGRNPSRWQTSVFSKCLNDANCLDQNRIYTHRTTGFYRQSGSTLPTPHWTPSPFRRTVRVVVVDPKRELRVISTVSYTSISGTTRNVEVSTVLYNWFPYLEIP
jgi:Tfp pilus assembly protein PilV